MNSVGKIYKISVSETKGDKKYNIASAVLREDHGIVGDAHAGSSRQVSLLPFESFDKVREKLAEIAPGDFAENLTTTGVDFGKVKIGMKMRIGSSICLEITQIGKECHHGCYIRDAVGDCIMPREGIFARVISGGDIAVGDSIDWEYN